MAPGVNMQKQKPRFAPNHTASLSITRRSTRGQTVQQNISSSLQNNSNSPQPQINNSQTQTTDIEPQQTLTQTRSHTPQPNSTSLHTETSGPQSEGRSLSSQTQSSAPRTGNNEHGSNEDTGYNICISIFCLLNDLFYAYACMMKYTRL